jgi:hypothetical protein
MNCVLSPLPCPVVDGECDRDGECYVWRCENPHAPKPISDDDLLAQFAELILRVNAARMEA